MTAQKHFKQLVRTRMTRTGESYMTARRQILRDAPAEPTRDGPDRWHLPGVVPAATALRILMNAAGARAPGGGPIGEALAFGAAGGIGIGVCAMYYAKEDFASFFVAGRHLWHDDAEYLTKACKRLGVEAIVRESGGAKAADAHLRAALADGQPAIAFVDAAHLPHRALPAHFSGGGYHVITVYAIDDARGVARIGDLHDHPFDIPLDALAEARGRIRKFKNRVIHLEPRKPGPDWKAALDDGIRACATALSSKPRKGFPEWFTLPAVRTWGERLADSGTKDGWESVFARGHRLWTGLTSVYDFIENYGTGGGLCRPMFAEFLGHAADVLRRPALRDAAERYAALGEQWSALASAALPAGAPLFREVRELYARRGEMMAEASADRVGELRDVWQEILSLGQRAKTTFPLSEAECAGLRRDLQKRVLAIHEGEVAALDALGRASA